MKYWFAAVVVIVLVIAFFNPLATAVVARRGIVHVAALAFVVRVAQAVAPEQNAV